MLIHYPNSLSSQSLPSSRSAFLPTTATTSETALSMIESQDALGAQDIISGTVLAFSLAFLGSFLQGRSSSNFLLWRNQIDQLEEEELTSFRPSLRSTNTTEFGNSTSTIEEYPLTGNNNQSVLFDGDSWKEMSRPENYVFYNTRVKKNQKRGGSTNSDNKSSTNAAKEAKKTIMKKEKAWVLGGLLILFVPIFSIEFFLALSRQFMCGSDPLHQVLWAQELCSPHL